MAVSKEIRRYYIMRHGETDWNLNFRFQGSSDIALNEKGILQARRLGLRMASVRPDRVVTSPLSRAFRTAREIMDKNSAAVPIEQLADLREVSFGVWEGLTVPEIRKNDEEGFLRWQEGGFSYAPKGGETRAEIMARARAVVASIATDEPGATFIIAHGGVLRALIAALMKCEDSDVMWRLRMDNCSVSIVDVWRGKPLLLLMNDTHHLRLSEEMIEALSFQE